MLVLSRKQKETIVINGNIVITILKIDQNSISVGIAAPREITVNRGEVEDKINEGNANSD